MAVKKVLILLVPIILFTSCDMSRWYFRHGGKPQSEKSSPEYAKAPSQNQPESVRSNSQDTTIFFTDKQVSIISESPQTLELERDSKTIFKQSPSTTATPKRFIENTRKKESEHHQHSASAQRMHTNAGPFIALLILVFILGLAMIGALIFLISWIFVPIAIALRIALWGLLIIFCVYILLFLGLILFSD